MLHGFELVEGVEVDTGNALAEQAFQLAGGVFQTDLPHGFRIVGVGFQLGVEFVGNAGSAKSRHAGELLQGSGNQQSGNQWDAHTIGGKLIAPTQEGRVVEEELGDDELGPGIDFFDEETAVGLLVRIFDVAFRITCRADAKAAALSDVGNQFAGELVAVFGLPEVG